MTIATEFFFWEIDDDRHPGKRIKTTWRMDRETALQRHPNATPVLSSREVRPLPENENELHAYRPGAWLNKPKVSK